MKEMGKRREINLDDYKPLREIVFESLREAIISGELEPGERLMEIQLAEEMGVSRTPVREAIRKLELEGFVVMIPRKGAYVASMSLKDITEVFEIRGVLEGLAASLAAERITDEELENLERLLVRLAKCKDENDIDTMITIDTEFHEILFQSSRNQRLSQIISHLREQIQIFRARTLSAPGRMKVALDEHKQIVEALGQRDPEIARQIAISHIESAEGRIMDIIGNE